MQKKTFAEKNNSCKQENKTRCENKDAKKKENPLVREKLPFYRNQLTIFFCKQKNPNFFSKKSVFQKA